MFRQRYLVSRKEGKGLYFRELQGRDRFINVVNMFHGGDRGDGGPGYGRVVPIRGIGDNHTEKLRQP